MPRPSAVTRTRPPPAEVSMVRLASSVCKLLKPALHLLAELKQLLKICHAFR